jgi:hypothetical protein
VPIAYRFRHDSHYEIHKRSPDIQVADLARRQHGVVSRRQLAEVGLATGAINVRVVIRVTWRQLRDEPAQIARDLRAVLRRRSARRPR